MIASHSCCRFVVCTSMMWISRSTTSQRCSIGLRSGDCGGHLSKVNSLSCSRNQSEMSWALWHSALSCWKYIRRWEYCGHKEIDVVSRNTLWCLNDAQFWRTQSVARKYLYTITPHPAWTVDTRQKRSMLSKHPNDAAESETHQSRQPFSNLLMSSFGESCES